MPLSNQVFVFPILNLLAESQIPGKLKLGCDWGHIVSVSGPGWAGLGAGGYNNTQSETEVTSPALC